MGSNVPTPVSASPGFTSGRLQRLIEMERSHFWFAGRRDLIRSLLGRYLPAPHARLADIGCGGGYNCQTLAAQSYRMTAVDFLPEGLWRLSRSTPAIDTVQSAAMLLALRGNSFDGVLALDVLEHLDDDAAAAAELCRILRPGGILLVTVPAFDWLWSYRDEAAGHRRRYRRERLRQLLGRAGYTVERTGYYNFFLLPVAALSRFAGRALTSTARDAEDLPPPFINSLFRSINRAEVRWGATRDWPCGSSLFAVARKRS